MEGTESIRRAVHDAIDHNPNRIKGAAIALRMGVSTTTVYRWGEDGQVDIPLNRLIQLVLVTGDTRPVSALCETLGGAFVPVPCRERGEKLDIKALKEFSEFLHARSAALNDGKITAAELGRIKKEGSDVIRVIAQAMADAERGFRGE